MRKGLHKEKYVYVKFENSSMKYIYQTSLNCKIGTIVEAPTLNYVIMKKAIVTDIKFLSDDELPIDKSKILTITKILSQKDEEGIFDKITYMKKAIEQRYLKEWKFDHENDWVKCWGSAFGATISYEQDGVLEVYFGEFLSDNFFSDYTTTSSEDFDLKLKYLETITSQLYYNKISQEKFKEMIGKIP